MPPRTSEGTTGTFEFRFPELDQDYLQRIHEVLRREGFVCIKQRWIIYYLRRNGARLCQQCAENIPNNQLFLIKYSHWYARSPVPIQRRSCHRCHVRLAELQPIADCIQCLDEIIQHLEKRRTFVHFRSRRNKPSNLPSLCTANSTNTPSINNRNRSIK